MIEHSMVAGRMMERVVALTMTMDDHLGRTVFVDLVDVLGRANREKPDRRDDGHANQPWKPHFRPSYAIAGHRHN